MEVSVRDAANHAGQTLLGLLGLGFTAAYVVFFYVFRDAQEIADASVDGYLEVVLLGIPPIVLLSAVIWLRESTIDHDLHARIPRWTAGMAVVFTAVIATVLFVIEPRFNSGEKWLILLLSLGFGGTAGTIMGILKSRALQYERDSNRARLKARRRERERKQLEHLNHYLRHEVLNEANKVSGYAALLEDHVTADDDADRYLTNIRRSGEEIAEFIRSIRTILETADHEPELAAVDVVATLETELERVRLAHTSVTPTLDAPESASVLAGDLLSHVFSNLIENAINHNDGPVSITVTVEETPDRVTVRLRDDGTGIPDEKRDALFDPPTAGDHGYGLFLTNNLVAMYGGQLELADTGPDGTEFAVHLEPAAPAPDAHEHSPATLTA